MDGPDGTRIAGRSPIPLTERLVARSTRHDRAAAAPRPPIRWRASCVDGGRRTRRVADGAARTHEVRRHPAGPARRIVEANNHARALLRRGDACPIRAAPSTRARRGTTPRFRSCWPGRCRASATRRQRLDDGETCARPAGLVLHVSPVDDGGKAISARAASPRSR